MFSTNIHEQTIIEISQGDYIATTAESFLVDRQSAGLSQHTLKFYRQFQMFKTSIPILFGAIFLCSVKTIIQEECMLPTAQYARSCVGLKKKK